MYETVYTVIVIVIQFNIGVQIRTYKRGTQIHKDSKGIFDKAI